MWIGSQGWWPCFLSWGPTRREKREEVSRFHLGPLYLAQEFLQYPPLSTLNMEWEGREADTGLPEAQATCLPTNISAASTSGRGLTEPRSKCEKGLHFPLFQVMRSEFRASHIPKVL